MNQCKNIPDKATSSFTSFIAKKKKYVPAPGFFFLLSILIVLSALASVDFSKKPLVLVAGEISPFDITSDRTFFFEDKHATKEKIDQVKQMQPLVCDLFLAPVEELRSQFQGLFIALNQATSNEDKEALRETLSREIRKELTPEAIEILSAVEHQEEVTGVILPFLQQQMSLGILLEMRPVLPYKGGIVIRNLATKEETYLHEATTIPDVKSLEAALSQRFKDLSGSARYKRILLNTLAAFIQPTLIPNYEATLERTAFAEKQIEPVVQRIEKGEVIVRQGEKVSHEQQIKLQSLMNTKGKVFNIQLFFGAIICGCLLSSGLLFSPSGRATSRMRHRDYVFIGVLVGLCSLIARGLHCLGEQLATNSMHFSTEVIAYAVPVAGAAALASLIFSTRRYLVTGLLLAFFSTLMCNGGVSLFLYFFLSAMWSTWLTSRTQSRQDVIWSAIPLTGGLLAMWLGATLYQGGGIERLIPEAINVLSSVVLSITLTFSLAPLIEMVFGYTTRFRLMELLNLEQPLLRELMLNAPGTYHHSLIVSNMVEAGAESIGAHSLLCKVAALYHDVGKVSKAAYFIENQFSEQNPHDRLTPSMSALILISHVKIGVELAEEHHLGCEVIDIISQHHGSGLIRYFYQKALSVEEGPAPKEEDFSYPGKKPQTREAALVLLADAVEASSRTLHEPTPTKLQHHINTVIKGIYSSGQLDECDLTFKDLDMITHSFQRVLRGIFHHRIVYPDKLSKSSPQSFTPTKAEIIIPFEKNKGINTATTTAPQQ